MSLEPETRRENAASPALWGLFWPALLLLVEATALTPLVEFSQGPMAWLAHPLTLSAGMWDPLESTCRHASLSIL